MVATKAHASPVLYAIEYLRGRLTADDLQEPARPRRPPGLSEPEKEPVHHRSLHGLHGAGAVTASFARAGRALRRRPLGPARPPERFVAMVGDAELDEGNVWESLLEEHVAGLGNLLWIVDMNRQSLDRVVPDMPSPPARRLVQASGLAGDRAALGPAAPVALRPSRTARAPLPARGDVQCRVPGAPPPSRRRQCARRSVTAPDGQVDAALDRFLGDLSDPTLQRGRRRRGRPRSRRHPRSLRGGGDGAPQPCVILAQTVKGWGLPLAGDPMNHGALLGARAAGALRERARRARGTRVGRVSRVEPGVSTDLPAGPRRSRRRRFMAPSPRSRTELDETLSGPGVHPGGLRTRPRQAWANARGRSHRHPVGRRGGDHASGGLDQSQGRVLPAARARLLRRDAAGDAVEGIAGGAARRARHRRAQPVPRPGRFRPRASCPACRCFPSAPSTIRSSPAGSTRSTTRSTRVDGSSSWPRPRGEPFPEGGAHQSVITPGIGVALPAHRLLRARLRLRESKWILLRALASLLDRENGESLYLRLSTKPMDQSLAPAASPEYRANVLRGGYRLVDARRESPAGIPSRTPSTSSRPASCFRRPSRPRACSGAEGIFASVFAVTSPDRLYRGLREPRPYLEELVTAGGGRRAHRLGARRPFPRTCRSWARPSACPRCRSASIASASQAAAATPMPTTR